MLLPKDNFQESNNKGLSWLKLTFKFFFYSGIFFVLAFAIFFSKALVTDQSADSWWNKIPIIGQIKHLAESADKPLKGEDRDRINILLLGMGGKEHEGGYLTDTIMLASIEPSTKKVALMSIPRDLTVPMEDRGWRKINNINAYAEWEEENSGGKAISQALGDILEMPIDYYVRVDFEGFTNIVNILDGVTVYVENTLEDYRYPIMGRENAEPYESRFEHLYVEEGWQKMDGDTALKFARSRHAYGIEGSDFARAKRQQNILSAVKDKVINKKLLLQPNTIIDIMDELDNHMSTNLKVWEIIKLWSISKDINKDDIVNKVLDNTPNGLLVDARGLDGAYILTPRSGDFDEIKYLAHNIFSNAPIEEKTKVTVEKSTIDIRNGTWINGLASQNALDIEKLGFEIIRIGNASRQNFQKSVIYDLTYGGKQQSLEALKERTNANVSFELPDWLTNDIANEISVNQNPVQPDFILILGQDADKSSSGISNEEE